MNHIGEPTANDTDGDGVPNDSDNCPAMFNPPTLLSSNMQADADSDGIGDMCDLN